jgi:hypothetical protein
MKTVKAKQTLHGAYGLKAAGDIFEVHDSIAEKLVEKDLVELVEEGVKDTKTAEQVQEEITIATNKAIDDNAAKKRAEKSK